MIALDTADLVVIDDDEDLRMLTTLTFRLQGWNVLAAPDGMSGLRALRDLVESGVRPAVLLDVQMPVIDGWEILSLIRADDDLRDLAVLLCTVRAGEEDRRRGYALGADGFVGKPFDLDDLVDAVTAVSRLSAEQRVSRRKDPRSTR